VDFRSFHQAKRDRQKKEIATEIVSAFKEVGFVYLRGHGIADNEIHNVFGKVCQENLAQVFSNYLFKSKAFFDQPIEQKVR
jgi:isopenicillin N synthase-like dioxygenase